MVFPLADLVRRDVATNLTNFVERERVRKVAREIHQNPRCLVFWKVNLVANLSKEFNVLGNKTSLVSRHRLFARLPGLNFNSVVYSDRSLVTVPRNDIWVGVGSRNQYVSSSIRSVRFLAAGNTGPANIPSIIKLVLGAEWKSSPLFVDEGRTETKRHDPGVSWIDPNWRSCPKMLSVR